MEMNNKFLLATALVMSMFLAACSSNDTVEEDASAAVDSAQEQRDKAAEEAAAKARAAEEQARLESQRLAEQGKASWDSLAAEGKLVYYFGFDNDGLSAETREALDTVAKVLKATNVSVTLNGHADERGTREYNLALSERRAKSVRDYLVVQGVNSSKIEVVGFGEEKPAVAQSNESAWAKTVV